MSKEDLKNVKEYQYLKKDIFKATIIVCVWICCVAIGTIPFWFGEVSKVVLGAILLVALIITMMFSPIFLSSGMALLKIKRGLRNYELVEAAVTTSSQSYFSKKLRCSGYLIKNNVHLDFKVYMEMYENGIEIKNGNIVSIWYNENNGSALFVSKK